MVLGLPQIVWVINVTRMKDTELYARLLGLQAP